MLTVGLFVLGGGAALSRIRSEDGGPDFVPCHRRTLHRAGIPQRTWPAPARKLEQHRQGLRRCIRRLLRDRRLVWGAVNMRGGLSVGGASLLGSVLGSVAGVGLAFALAAVVSSAIGTSTSSAASRQQSRKQTLSDCVAAASTTPQILACEAKYGTP